MPKLQWLIGFSDFNAKISILLFFDKVFFYFKNCNIFIVENIFRNLKKIQKRKIKQKMMIETIDIKEFLRTGNFGEFKEIHFGMTRNKLIEILDETEWKHFSFRKSKFPSIYKYGKVEFYFEEGKEGRLCGIQILPTIQETELMNLKIIYAFVNPKLKYESALKLLDNASIKYQEIQSEFDTDDIKTIETIGGVQIIFSEDFEESISIHKISKFVSLSSNQAKEQQISFSIPQSDYQKLKDAAIKEQKSISKICKEIIIKKLDEK